MCGQGIISSRDMQINKTKKPTKPRPDSNTMKTPKATKIFSADTSMTCKTFCCVCDKVVPLSTMKNHTRTWHKMSLTEYKELYGNPKRQIIQVVYHSCVICKTTVLFDPKELYKHLKKHHAMSYKEYSTTSLGQLPPANTVNNNMEASQLSVVLIRCDHCDKTFKQNIQLKIHKKKQHS